MRTLRIINTRTHTLSTRSPDISHIPYCTCTSKNISQETQYAKINKSNTVEEENLNRNIQKIKLNELTRQHFSKATATRKSYFTQNISLPEHFINAIPNY